MSTDFRALCAELADDLQEARDAVSDWASYASKYTRQKRNLQEELDRIQRQIARARAALAAPEQGPTDEEIKAAYWDAFKDAAPCGAEAQWLAGLRAVARFARPAIEPVPVSERLPGPEDCDGQGRCWVYAPEDSMRNDGWTLAWHRFAAPGREFTHWIPHHALPVPQQEAGR